MADYQIISATCVLRKSDGASIPFDEANRDYQEFQLWLAQGNTPDPVPAPSTGEQKADLLGQIAFLEAFNIIPRALRDIILKDSTNAAYAKTKALDDQITALREQIKALPAS
jgi:hypothetical protein